MKPLTFIHFSRKIHIRLWSSCTVHHLLLLRTFVVMCPPCSASAGRAGCPLAGACVHVKRPLWGTLSPKLLLITQLLLMLMLVGLLAVSDDKSVALELINTDAFFYNWLCLYAQTDKLDCHLSFCLCGAEWQMLPFSFKGKCTSLHYFTTLL